MPHEQLEHRLLIRPPREVAGRHRQLVLVGQQRRLRRGQQPRIARIWRSAAKWRVGLPAAFDARRALDPASLSLADTNDDLLAMPIPPGPLSADESPYAVTPRPHRGHSRFRLRVSTASRRAALTSRFSSHRAIAPPGGSHRRRESQGGSIPPDGVRAGRRHRSKPGDLVHRVWRRTLGRRPHPDVPCEALDLLARSGAETASRHAQR